MRAFLPLLLLLAPLPAHALDSCYPDVTGTWRGPAMNEGRIETVITEFTLDASGAPTGRYHVEAREPFDGTLTDFRETGPCAGDFTWTDRYGSGVVHIDFEPERARFLGNWGVDWPTPENIFNGFRIGTPPTS